MAELWYKFLLWFYALSEAEQVTVLTVVTERIVQGLRWLLTKLNVPLGETWVDKLAKMLLALLTSAAMAYPITGPTDKFYEKWLMLFATATLLHEFGGKPIRAYRETKAKREAEADDSSSPADE